MAKRLKDKVFETHDKKLLADEVKSRFEALSYNPYELTKAIFEFGKVLTGIPIYEDYQEPFIKRVIHAVVAFENETLTALWSRQSGKSESLAFIIDTLTVILPLLAPIFPEFKQWTNGFRIGLYAPQQLQVDTTYSRAMERISSENADIILTDPDFDVSLTSSRRLELSNGSYMIGQVASKSSKIESKTFDLILIEECQDMDDFVMQKSIEPMTSATGGTVVKVGTTGTTKNNFYVEIADNKKQQRKIKDPALLLHFEFDYLKVIAAKRKQYDKEVKETGVGNRFHLNYEVDVLKKRRKWGEDSDAFKLGYALIWPLESGMFITEGGLDALCNNRLGVPDLKKTRSSGTICAGIDFGKDNDSTVITIGRSFYPDDEYSTEPPNKQIFCWIELVNESYEIQHYTILEALAYWGVEIAYMDYTGVGRPLVDRLMVACGENVLVIPYTFTRQSKSDMWFALDADCKERRLVIPANKTVRSSDEFANFWYQMTNLQKSFDAGYMICQHGPGTGEHDDYPDSCALFVMAGNHDLPDEIEESPNIFYAKESYTPSHRSSHW